MDGSTVFWHLANFFAPAAVVGPLAAALAKLLWRRELATASWRRLSVWAAGASASVLVLGLLVFGRDGRMWTYAGMVAACAAALWWQGFGARRG